MHEYQDIYTLSNTSLETAIKSLGKMGRAKAYGRTVHVSDSQIIIEQNSCEGVADASDFIIIPKGCIIEEDER